jgi:hypothetical protein
MPVAASRRARWTRQELLAWILHKRNPAVDECAKIATERGARLLPSMEAGLAVYQASFARRQTGPTPGKISTPRRVRAANRLLECAEASGKIEADGAGRFSSQIARKLWGGPKPGRAPLPLHSRNDVFRLAAAIQEHPKRDYVPKDGTGRYTKECNTEAANRARRQILKKCGINARKGAEVSSLFQAAIRLARKHLDDGGITESPGRLGEKPIRCPDGSVLHPSVSMPSPLDPAEHKRRSENVETWAARGNPHVHCRA